ncbi:MAG: SDR family oxidoreductase [Gammaproteobacteria bacterium]|nr:SDR family oxidoreductase [Gammaproteobacteria bacterium]MCY4256665.1 SDR family oxidoreductase [Gammaproteobacteria bacterium]
MTSNLFDLRGKTALVTGCKRGIGEAIAVGLAEAGADIIGVSATLELSGSPVERAVRAAGQAFHAYQCDFGRRARLYEFIAAVRKDHGAVDVLVNNAGTIRRAPAAEHGDEDWDRVLEVNLSAQFILSRELGRGMAERGAGKIIFTASLLSFQGGVTVPGYAASKGGLKQLIMALANEWGGQGLNINGIAPGYVETDNTAALRADPQRFQAILERIPQGRWGTPDDFKGPAVFLASRASDYVNGSILLVDGGWMGR